MSAEELRFMERKRLYPPRFVVTIRRSSTVRDSTVVFTFEGAAEEIVKEVILTKGTLWEKIVVLFVHYSCVTILPMLIQRI